MSVFKASGHTASMVMPLVTFFVTFVKTWIINLLWDKIP